MRPHLPPQRASRRLALPTLVLVAVFAALVGSHWRPASAATGTFVFSSATYTVVEGGAPTITINRSGGTDSATATVNIVGGSASCPADYTPLGGCGGHDFTFTFGAGALTASRFNILNTINNFVVDGSRTILLRITSVSGDGVIGVTDTATITILDNDGAPLPTITSIYPHSGQKAGGALVTLTGTNFTGTTCSSILFGIVPASSCSISSTQITVTAPPQLSAGLVSIRVDNGNGSSPDTSADDFVYGAGPVIYAVNPSTGPAGGGASTTIVGKGFSGLSCSDITFDGLTPTSCGTITDTAASVVPRAHAAGTADVQVVVGSIPNPNTVDDDYTYTGGPALVDIFPHSGTTGGGTLVTVTGTALAGTSSVTFGGSPGSIQTVSATSVTVLTPGHAAGAVDVMVSGTSGSTTLPLAFVYAPGPTVTSLNPDGGPTAGGNTVVVNGTGFVSGSTTVRFGGFVATGVSVNNSTQLTAVAPGQSAGTVDVQVIVSGVPSPNTADDDYLYGSLAPTVSGVSPSGGSVLGGYTVTVTGSGFSAGVLSVLFGTTGGTNLNVTGDSLLTVTAPDHAAGVVPVRVVTPNGISADTPADDFNYGTAPIVTSVSPNTGSAAGGTFVTITGANFGGALSVAFGGTITFTFTVNQAGTSIAVVSPPHSAGVVDVTVTTGSGPNANTTADNFTYTGSAPPTILSISPSGGPLGGGTPVTITGTGFLGATSVKFGGVPGTNLVVVSDSTITVTTPVGMPAGAIDVIVTTPRGANPAGGAARFTVSGGSGGTFTYTLYSHFSLFAWGGLDNLSVSAALRGLESPDNPATNDVSASVTAIFKWSPNGAGCPAGQSSCWLAWFPNAGNVPGAVNFTTLDYGEAYWWANGTISALAWTILAGP
ncbi:MAG: IPT/TIG domain-containing protein [Dehalococcoidia bacterium]|nr:IPT/TIG domain-containing protein [Dehalococcoidia bacterium]